MLIYYTNNLSFYRNHGDGEYSRGHCAITPESATIAAPNIISYGLIFILTFYIISFYVIVFRSPETKKVGS